MATLTLVEELAGVRGHLLNLAVTTVWAGDLGAKFGLHGTLSKIGHNGLGKSLDRLHRLHSSATNEYGWQSEMKEIRVRQPLLEKSKLTSCCRWRRTA
jgi:hypothetical protein